MSGYSVSQIHFTERSRTTTRTPASYWLLLAFLFLLYANLPLVMPALDALRPAKVVAGLALVMLLAERASARESFDFAWPEGCLLLGFLGAAALSSVTALWPHLAADSVSDLLKMTIVFFFIVNCANTERRLRGVMWTMVVGGLLPAAGTLRNYLQGNMVDGRAAWVGIFANPNELAYGLVILLPLAAYLATGLGLIPVWPCWGLHSYTWRRSWSPSRAAECWGWGQCWGSTPGGNEVSCFRAWWRSWWWQA